MIRSRHDLPYQGNPRKYNCAVSNCVYAHTIARQPAQVSEELCLASRKDMSADKQFEGKIIVIFRVQFDNVICFRRTCTHVRLQTSRFRNWSHIGLWYARSLLQKDNIFF
jgi:hypothetical protein